MTDQNPGNHYEDELNTGQSRFLSKFLSPEIREKISKVYFITIKLPLILFVIVAGFIFEFVVELPFMMLVFLDYRSQKKGEGRP
ncbi:MAG: hypothetical protein R6X10_06615 [Desulfobacterales bacterium]